jgi:hypothetical protein
MTNHSPLHIYKGLLRQEQMICIALEALEKISMTNILRRKNIADKALDAIFLLNKND